MRPRGPRGGGERLELELLLLDELSLLLHEEEEDEERELLLLLHPRFFSLRER